MTKSTIKKLEQLQNVSTLVKELEPLLLRLGYVQTLPEVRMWYDYSVTTKNYTGSLSSFIKDAVAAYFMSRGMSFYVVKNETKKKNPK